MNRQTITIWIAGFMVGTGCGLIVARSLPSTPVSEAGQAVNSLQSLPDSQADTARQSYLTDPMRLSDSEDRSENVSAQGMKSPIGNSPEEPRLFPEGVASPVDLKQKQTRNPGESSQAFRKQLEKIAPEFSETALNDLEKIRTAIESGENLPANDRHDPAGAPEEE